MDTKFNKYIGLFGLCFILVACGPGQQQVINFNDTLVEEQTNVINTLDALYDTYSDYDPDKMEGALAMVEKNCIECLENLKNVNVESGEKMKSDVQRLCDYIYKKSQGNLKRVVELLSIPDEEYTEEFENEVSVLQAEVDSLVYELNEQFLASQQAFANKHNFILTYD